MRRYESEYRLTRTSIASTSFQMELQAFNQTLGSIIAAEIMKEGLNQQVKTYADTFAEWMQSTDTVRADVASLDLDLRSMMPVTDDIIASARFNAVTAATAAHRVAVAHQEHHHPGGLRRRADRARLQLADRPQHHRARSTGSPAR